MGNLVALADQRFADQSLFIVAMNHSSLVDISRAGMSPCAETILVDSVRHPGPVGQMERVLPQAQINHPRAISARRRRALRQTTCATVKSALVPGLTRVSLRRGRNRGRSSQGVSRLDLRAFTNRFRASGITDSAVSEPISARCGCRESPRETRDRRQVPPARAPASRDPRNRAPVRVRKYP